MENTYNYINILNQRINNLDQTITEGNLYDVHVNGNLTVAGNVKSRLYQELNSNVNWNSVNGYYGLAKDAYPSLSKYVGNSATSSFTFRQIAGVSTPQYSSITWSAKLGLFCVMRNENSPKDIYLSPDGISWKVSASQSTSNIAGRWRALCWSDELGIFCAVSEIPTTGNPPIITGFGGNVITSSNGTNWTTINTGYDNFWRDICWSPELGLFCAVASREATVNYTRLSGIMISNNGNSWTFITPPEDKQWYAVCWSAELGLFCAVAPGSDGIMVSKNGLVWNMVKLGAIYGGRTICWSRELGLLCASANGPERIMVSKNGLDWNIISSPLNGYTLYSIIWCPVLNMFSAVGTVSGISSDGYNWSLQQSNLSSSILKHAWSPELGLICGVSFTGSGSRGAYTSQLIGRPPTALNVFNSPYNIIDDNGNWTIQSILKQGSYFSGNTTVNVSGVQYLKMTNNSPLTLSSLTDGVDGQVLTLLFNDSNTTVSGANIKLSGAFTSSSNDTVRLLFNGSNWLELSRSINSP